MPRHFLDVPASMFGMVLGLSGLGACWRAAARSWHLPTQVGETITLGSALVWSLLVVLFALKWTFRRAEALAEFDHPIQCCFVGLVPVATMVVALSILPYSHSIGLAMGVTGVIVQLGFAVYRTGILWTGGRDHSATTPILYLPMVAGNLVSANLASAFGMSDLASLFFGGGLFAWLALESVLLHRLYVERPLVAALRPTLGIQLAPAFVSCSAYLMLTSGTPDLFAKALFGYGLLQGLILVRLLPWIAEQPFAAGYWAFSFGLTAAAYDSIVLVQRGAAGIFPALSITLFVVTNICMLAIVAGTILLIFQGKLIPGSAGRSLGEKSV